VIGAEGYAQTCFSADRLYVRVNTFVEFLETWKYQGILQSSVKGHGKGTKSGKCQGICVVREICKVTILADR